MSNLVWPDIIIQNSATRALESSLSQERLGHGLLFVSDDSLAADAAAETLSMALLGTALPNADYTRVDPMNKQRQIGVDAMRQLREFLQKSSLSGVKVAHVSQADRLQSSAANLFLKILEEPPANSYIIMTTSAPHAVLPTLVSRSMRFRFCQKPTPKDSELKKWRDSFVELLSSGNAGDLMRVYALMDKAHGLLVSQEEAYSSKTQARDDALSPDVQEALVAAHLKMAQRNLFAVMEEAVLEAFKAKPSYGYRLREALKAVERVYRMLEFNLNAPAALESAIGGVAKALG